MNLVTAAESAILLDLELGGLFHLPVRSIVPVAAFSAFETDVFSHGNLSRGSIRAGARAS